MARATGYRPTKFQPSSCCSTALITTRWIRKSTHRRFQISGKICTINGWWTMTPSPPTNSCIPIKAPSIRAWRAPRVWTSGSPRPIPLRAGGPNGEEPGLLRKVGAAIISPSLGLNRLVYGDRFAGVFRSNDPAVFTRVDLGESLSTHFYSNVNANADLTAPPAAQTFKRQSASAIFTMAYGLPGKPEYSYDRPFDYFNFELSVDTTNAAETVFSRGWLYGTDYALGPNYRGIWGF